MIYDEADEHISCKYDCIDTSEKNNKINQNVNLNTKPNNIEIDHFIIYVVGLCLIYFEL